MSEYKPEPDTWRIGDAGHTIFGPKTENPSPKMIAQFLSKKDATFIVKACQAYDPMFKALNELLNCPRTSLDQLDPETKGALIRAMKAVDKAIGDK